MSNVIDTNYINLNGSSYCNAGAKTSRTFETVFGKKEEASLPVIEGDVIMHDPPNAMDKERFRTIVNKSREDMTLNEYKLYICNKIANLPVSGFWRAYGNSSIIIKEEAFNHMKEDPEYEEQIMKLISSEFTVVSPFPVKIYGYQVIGGTIDGCYGEGYGDTSSDSASKAADKEESFWQKRHKRIKKRIKEEAKLAKRVKELKIAEQEKMMQAQTVYQRERYSWFLKQNQTEYGIKVPFPVKRSTTAVSLPTIVNAIGEYENTSIF